MAIQLIPDPILIDQAKGQTAESALEQKSVTRAPGQGVVDNSPSPGPVPAFGGGGGGSGLNTNQGANPPELTDEEASRVATPVFEPEGDAVAFQSDPETISSEDDAKFDGRLIQDGELEVGTETDDTGTADIEQNALSSEQAISQGRSLYENVLHNYASSTYRIGLYLLSKSDFDDLTENPGSFVPKNLLVQTGGGQGEAGRHPDFDIDFFIDNLKFNSIVGMNAKTQASNTFLFTFDIVEPYGMTLLDRLISANSGVGSTNYLAQPYLLQIDFLGNATDTENDFLIDSKRFPIRFQSMSIKPGDGSTTYKISAIAFNHQAFQKTTATVPVTLTVEAGTLGDFFDNEDLEQEEDTAKSFPAAVNSFYRSIAGEEEDKKYKFPPLLIKFNIDPLFRDSKVVDPDSTELRTVPMTPFNTQASASWSGTAIPSGKTVQIYKVNSGSNINSVIDRMMQKSEYITSQLKAFNEAKQEGDIGDQFRFLDWYKIVPDVKLGEYDDGEAKAYAKEVTYSVIPYKVANAYHPDFAKTKISKKNIVRSYNYLYTGRNTDITSLDINFDTAFYTSQTAFVARKAESSGGSVNKRDQTSYQGDNKASNVDDTPEDLPTSVVPTGINAKRSGELNRGDDFTSISVSDLAESLYSKSGGDMLNIRMSILGDPAFIKQDDVYHNPARGGFGDFSDLNDPDAPVNTKGQVLFDQTQVFVQLLVKSAVDIDHETGLVNPNKKILLTSGYRLDSTFSGVFKVVMVDSTFAGGEFNQTLSLIKMPNKMFESDEDIDDSNNELVVDNTVVDEGDGPVNFIDAGPAPEQEQQTATNVLGIDNSGFESAEVTPAPEPQTTTNALGIQGNDLSNLQAARDSDPDSQFPIVNGAGTRPTAVQPTQSSPANIDDTNVAIEQSPPFSNPAQQA